MSSSANNQWATLQIELVALAADDGSRPSVAEEVLGAAQRLDDVGSRLAMDHDVDGVQTLDPRYDGVKLPGLLLYTKPHALARLEDKARSLLRDHDLPGATIVAEVRDDTQWQDLWKAYYRPLRFGDGRLLVRPSWIERTPDDPKLEIVLDPGRAFGTGLHPTTQLCLERLCDLHRAGRLPTSCLDLGCGSGILILSALRLFDGLERAVALDNDPEAMETTVENAASNGLAERLRARVGELASLADEAPFELIVANIRATVLIPLAVPLMAVVAREGTLTTSGILIEEGPSVADAFAAAGWTLERPARVIDDWCAFDFRHP